MESERRATLVRCCCASSTLLALRATPLTSRHLWLGFASTLATRPHTLEPPFVKPTPPELLLYAAELLHVLLHRSDESAGAPGASDLSSSQPLWLADDSSERNPFRKLSRWRSPGAQSLKELQEAVLGSTRSRS